MRVRRQHRVVRTQDLDQNAIRRTRRLTGCLVHRRTSIEKNRVGRASRIRSSHRHQLRDHVVLPNHHRKIRRIIARSKHIGPVHRMDDTATDFVPVSQITAKCHHQPGLKLAAIKIAISKTGKVIGENGRWINDAAGRLRGGQAGTAGRGQGISR